MNEWEAELKESEKLYEEYDGMDEEELKWALVNTRRLLKTICEKHNIDLLKELEELIIEHSKKLENLYDIKERV